MSGITGSVGRHVLSPSHRTFLQRNLFAVLLASTAAFVMADTSDTQTLSPKEFSEKISRHVSREDYEKAWELIEARELETPDDPDLAVVKANLLISSPDAKARVVIEKYPAGTQQAAPNVRDSIQVTDAETSEAVGYIGEYVPEGRDEAFKRAGEILSGAVKQHPDRLDIRMGISQLYALEEEYQGVFDNLQQTLDYASGKKYEGLLWAFDSPAEEPKQKLKDALHKYYSDYTRRTENPDDALAFKFAQASTKYFPDDIRGWNNLAAEYAQQQKQDKAIECLLRAHELDKSDGIVLMNIAMLYRKEENFAEATRYLKKVIELKDEELSQAAQEELDSIKAAQK